MIRPTRRLLLTAAGAVLGAPHLANAESFMRLRGPLLDPWVVAFWLEPYTNIYGEARGKLVRSQFDGAINMYPHALDKILGPMKAPQRVAYLNTHYNDILLRNKAVDSYELARESELDSHWPY